MDSKRCCDSVSKAFGVRYPSETVRRPGHVDSTPTENSGGVSEGYLTPKADQRGPAKHDYLQEQSPGAGGTIFECSELRHTLFDDAQRRSTGTGR